MCVQQKFCEEREHFHGRWTDPDYYIVCAMMDVFSLRAATKLQTIGFFIWLLCTQDKVENASRYHMIAITGDNSTRRERASETQSAHHLLI